MNPTDLRFLADESCDFAVVRALRAEGYEVIAVSEFMQRSNDAALIAQADVEKLILLTEDKDFGWLVFASRAQAKGVILIRFPGNARNTLAQTVCHVVKEQGLKLLQAFVVIQPGHIRITQLPPQKAERAQSS